jgi:hypothetical protein
MTDFAVSIEPIARHLLGEPNQRLSSKAELRYGARGSLSIDLRKDTWFDHEANAGGGALDLVTRQTGLTGSDVWRWLDSEGLHAQEPRTNGSARVKPTIVKTYDYRDVFDQLLFQVVRFEPKDFRQRRPDPKKPGEWLWSVKGIQPVLYRLPELEENVRDGRIVICEGEKDCDRLWSLNIPCTTNPGGVGKWRPEFSEYLRVANNVVILPDRDPQKKDPKTGALLWHDDKRPVLPGQDHAREIAAALTELNVPVRVVELWQHWHDMPLKGDVSDWLNKGGGNADLLNELIARTPLWKPDTQTADVLMLRRPFPIKEQEIPPRDWIVPGLLMRKQVTVLVAPSGAGKSLLTLQVGIACAQGQQWGDWRPRGPHNVLFVNAEDDYDEIRRRIAAATHRMRLGANNQYEIDQDAIQERFAIAEAPASQNGIVIAKFDPRNKTLITTPLFDQVIETIKANRIDVVFVDPFAETFELDENSNNELKQAGWKWRMVARETGAAVVLVHHTKKYATGMAGDVDAARGAGALIGIARIVSTIFPMTEKEGEMLLDDDDPLQNPRNRDRTLYLRYDDAKANLNLTSSVARWFFKDTVTLDNECGEPGTPEYQPADEVGTLVVAKKIKKSPLDNILEADINRFLDAVDRGIMDAKGEPTGEFYTFDTKKGSEHEMPRWVGDLAMSMFKLKRIEQAADFVNKLKKRNRLLDGGKYRSPRTRKERTRCLSERYKPAESDDGRRHDPVLFPAE